MTGLPILKRMTLKPELIGRRNCEQLRRGTARHPKAAGRSD